MQSRSSASGFTSPVSTRFESRGSFGTAATSVEQPEKRQRTEAAGKEREQPEFRTPLYRLPLQLPRPENVQHFDDSELMFDGDLAEVVSYLLRCYDTSRLLRSLSLLTASTLCIGQLAREWAGLSACRQQVLGRSSSYAFHLSSILHLRSVLNRVHSSGFRPCHYVRRNPLCSHPPGARPSHGNNMQGVLPSHQEASSA